jgi:acyl-coenzyme A synthetase/AMP-(fatty) acid ligase
MVVGQQLVDTIRGIQKDLPQVKHYISVSSTPVEGMLDYEALIREYPDDEPLVLVDDDDPAFIMYTAGTTGRPKGAVLSHKSQVMMWTAASIQLASEPGVGNVWDYRTFSPPPLFHMASFGFCQAHLLVGATVVLAAGLQSVRSWRLSSGRRSTLSCSYRP